MTNISALSGKDNLYYPYIRISEYMDIGDRLLIVLLDEMGFPQVDELNLLHANICQALGDIKRIQILYLLHEKPRRVSDLVDELDVPQPTVSRHLALLRQRLLVFSERNGTEVIYHLADPRIIEVLNEMRMVLREVLERQSSAVR